MFPLTPKEFAEVFDPTSNVNIFTDGACRGNPGPGGWGAVLQQNLLECEINGGAMETTNNRMEMMAVISALQLIPTAQTVVVTTDSKYVKNGMMEWCKKWVRNGWKTADGSPVKNIELWQQLVEATKKCKIEWKWVKGHNGHPENERADRLAVAGIPKGKNRSQRAENPPKSIIPPPPPPPQFKPKQILPSHPPPKAVAPPPPVVTEDEITKPKITFLSVLNQIEPNRRQEIAIQIFTSASVERKTKGGGWGSLIMFNDIQTVLKGGTSHASYEQMEIFAVTESLMFLPEGFSIAVYTHSENLATNVQKLQFWKRQQWTEAGKEIENVEQWKLLDRILNAKKVKILNVKGEFDPYVMITTQIANDMARKYSKKLNMAQLIV